MKKPFGYLVVLLLLVIGCVKHAHGAELDSAAGLVSQRQQLDRTVWANEVAAAEHEQAVIQLWDRLRTSTDPLATLGTFPFQRLTLQQVSAANTLELGIRELQLAGAKVTLDQDAFQKTLRTLVQQGFELEETEWHHSSFQNDEPSAKSIVSFTLHLRQNLPNDRPDARLIVRGKLHIEWQSQQTGDPQAKTIEARDVIILTRAGSAVFEHAFTYERRPRDVASAHPILLHDLDKNGYPEIIISRWNRIYWNQGSGKFQERAMLDVATPLAEAGIVGDFNDDGWADLMAVDKLGRLVLCQGSEDTSKRQAAFSIPHVVCDVRMPAALAMTAGDVDRDGDLDLWVSQYKPAYLNGQMPTPYYDANDGEPAYLLINDGDGRFDDATQSAGLGNKRNRRTYSSSFVDFDADQDLDLIVVSDYAGLDVYRNDGRGHFSDVTADLVDNRHLFGMAHTFADYDGNGTLDVYAIGMSSTTARRLDSMKLSRSDRADIAQMRSSMGFGNRIFAWNQDAFQTPKFFQDLARTGWSWGVTSFDYDLDGDEDTYVANGFRSGESCEDYCSTFWRHDIYTGNSRENPTVANLFANNMQSLNAGKTSWNGYEHNALLQNLDQQRYKNIAYLLGVGCEFDSRAVVGNDLDGDGRPDLIVTEYEFAGRGYIMKLHVFRNVLPTSHGWVGFRVPEMGGHGGLFGATAQLKAGGRTQIRHLVSGDSFLSQHDNVFHFGLGTSKQVDTVTIRWPDGQTKTLQKPALNRYHVVTPATQ